jgi:Mrp family chromosome partitioning ATPase/capsular polysaccharide biosynthesis protein
MNARQSIKTISALPTASPIAVAERKDSRFIGVIDAWMLIQRHLWLIILIVALSTAIAVVTTSLMQKLYVARSTVVLDRKDSRPFEIAIQLQTQDRDKSGTETEMDIMSSRLVAGYVVDELLLLQDPDYNKHFQDVKSGEASAQQIVKWRDTAVTKLLSEVSISRKGDSLVIIITVENKRPELAAKIADSIAANYVSVSMDFKRRFAIDAKQSLRDRGTNPLLTTIINSQAELQQSRAELAAKLGDKHPQILAIDARLDKLNSIISDQFDHMARDLNIEAERPSARLLSQADVPGIPSFPRSNLIVSATFAGSLLLGIIAALVIEGLASSIRNGEQVRQLLQLPNLTYVPSKAKFASRSRLNPVQEVMTQRQGGFAIAMRSLYLACRPPNSDQAQQVIMLTSCQSRRDGSRCALGLVATAAADGKKAILVDLDRHDLSVLRTLKFDSYPWPIEDFVSGKCTISDAIYTLPEIKGLNVIGSRKNLASEDAHLNSTGLDLLIATLRKEYDFIVIYAPPILNVDDANWLAPLVNAAILSITWGKTKEVELWDAAYSLRLNHVPLIGTFIEDVDRKLQRRYGLGNAVH